MAFVVRHAFFIMFIYIRLLKPSFCSGYAFFTGFIYVQLLSSSFWLTFMASTTLQAIIARAVPHPSCNSSSWGNPSFETQLVYHYVAMLIVHRLYWRIPIGVMAIARAAALCVMLPILYVWSGNSTIAQVVFGALAGLLVGLLSTVSIYLFWLPRIWVLTENPLVRLIEYTGDYAPVITTANGKTTFHLPFSRSSKQPSKSVKNVWLEPPAEMQRISSFFQDVLL